MKTTLVTIKDDATVFDAAKKMKENKVGSLIVLNSKNNKPYGIVTNDDIVWRCVAKKRMDCRVKDIASKPLLGTNPDADLRDAAKLMGSENVKRLVVFNGNEVVGIISSKDIIAISPSLYDLIAEKSKVR